MKVSKKLEALALFAAIATLGACKSDTDKECCKDKPATATAPEPTPAQVAAPTTPPLKFERSATGSVTARVTAIDVSMRHITLQGPSGYSEKFVVGPQVKRLSAVSVGDNVTLTYTVSLLGELRAPTAEESARPISYYNVSSRTASEDPSGSEGTAVKVVTTVDAVDLGDMLVTLKGPLGNRINVRARSQENIRKLHVGDTIIVTYYEGVGLALDKTP